MKKIVFLMLMLSALLSLAFAESMVFTNSVNGLDSAPITASITTAGIPEGSEITSTQITLRFGSLMYVGNWYDADLNVNGTDYTEVGWLTDEVYTELNGQGPNGLTVSATSIDNDDWDDTITLALTVEVFYNPPAGTPDPASNPAPAHLATNVPVNGNLTWDFGASTDAYDLWFGPTGNMTRVVEGELAGVSGSYDYSSLLNDTQYSWRVDTISGSSRITTTGPVWTFTTALPAGLVQIGTGTVTTLNLPLNPFYGYNYSQTLYLQSEIDIAGQRIEKLYYQWNGDQAGTNYKDWAIYIGHTDKTAFSSSSDWVPFANLTQVFNGVVNIPATPGWIEIVLTAPFNYNNTDNLVIAVNETTPSYGSNTAKFYGTSFGTNRGLRLQNDDSAYNPASPGSGTLVAGIANIKMQFGEPPAVPTFSYSPGSLAFAFTQAETSSAAQNVTVTNTGAGTLSFGASDVSIGGTDAGDFSFDPVNLPADLTTGQSAVIPVTFSPQSAGQKSATLIINYNSVDYEVTLSGYAYAATANFEGFEGTTFPPAGWANPGSWSRSTYTVFEGSGSASKSSYSTTPYILSTPKLDIVGGDELVFMARISTITAALDIVYSTDRATWTKLGESILAPTANTWFPVIVDLGAIPAKTGAYYLGFRTMASASYYIDNVIMPPFTQEAPEAVTLTAPTDAATNQSILPTLSWTTAATGGIPTSFDIYLEASDDIGADPREFLVNVPASPYTLTTPLQYSTTYIWKVVAKNANGDAPASAVHSFTTMTDPTVTPPYVEGFENGHTHNTAIAGWTQQNVTGTGAWTANNTLTDYNRSPRTGGWNAFLRYSNTRWMFKPVNVISGKTYRVTVYARQDGATAANASIGISYGADANAAAMTNAILAPTGIINGDYQRLEGVFTADATGITYIGILGTINGSPWYISIDDISIEEVSENPTFAIDPTSWNYNQIQLGQSGTKVFAISNAGGGTLEIAKEDITVTGDNADQFILTPITEDISLEAGQSTQITVSFVPASEGHKSATLQIIDNTTAEKSGMKSGTKATQTVALTGEGFDATISSFPWSESFETEFPPTGWTNSNWGWSLYGGANTGEEWAYSNLSGATLDTTPFALPTDSALEFSFWYRAEGASYPQDLSVEMTVDGTPLGTPIISIEGVNNTVYEKASFDLTSYAGQLVAFSFIGLTGAGGFAWGICIDDVTIKGYDYPSDQPITIGEGEDAITITVSGGSANNVPGGEIPPVNNAAFVAAGSFVLQLIGAGPWTVTIETDAPWGAYYRSGSWTAVENVGGFITFYVEASKDLTMPIVLGPVDPTLPVTLASFTAVLTSDLHVNIAWMAESEVDHAGYNLLRSEVNELSTARRINASMIDNGTANGSQMSYIYTDKEVYYNALYYYWLESVSLTGESEYHGPIMVLINADGEEPGIPSIPIETKLFSAFPNPFNPSTNLRYSMKEAGDVRIDVYNVKGQILKTFENHHSLPGYYQVNWDGRDMNGRVVGTGVYFYRMSSGKYSATKKMVLAK